MLQYLIVPALSMIAYFTVKYIRKPNRNLVMDIFNTPIGYYATNMLARRPHRTTRILKSGHLQVFVLPVLESNYTFLIADMTHKTGTVIDPSQTDLVIETLEKHGLRLIAILNTHKHWDHTSGNVTLESMYSNVPVYGNKVDFETTNKRYTRITHYVDDGQDIIIGTSLFRVIHTPGHTRGSVVYLLDINGSFKRFGAGTVLSENKEWNCTAPWLFTGDTLFLGGCGKLFEGDAGDLYYSFKKLHSLIPVDTYVFAGHEYTLSNLEFVRSLSDSKFVEDAYKEALDCDLSNTPTVPGKWGIELQCNPFLFVLTKQVWTSLPTIVKNKAKDKNIYEKQKHLVSVKYLDTATVVQEDMVILGCLRALKNDFKSTKSVII